MAQGPECQTTGCLGFLNRKAREVTRREFHRQGLGPILRTLRPCPPSPNPSSGDLGGGAGPDPLRPAPRPHAWTPASAGSQDAAGVAEPALISGAPLSLCRGRRWGGGSRRGPQPEEQPEVSARTMERGWAEQLEGVSATCPCPSGVFSSSPCLQHHLPGQGRAPGWGRALGLECHRPRVPQATVLTCGGP